MTPTTASPPKQISSSKMMILLGCFAVFLTGGASSSFAEPTVDQVKLSEEYQIGVMVKALASAMKASENPESLKVIAKYGTDSRYYVMIRGWLNQELRGVESQHAATRDPERKAKFQKKVMFLKKAIRRIDLE